MTRGFTYFERYRSDIKRFANYFIKLMGKMETRRFQSVEKKFENLAKFVLVFHDIILGKKTFSVYEIAFYLFMFLNKN